MERLKYLIKLIDTLKELRLNGLVSDQVVNEQLLANLITETVNQYNLTLPRPPVQPNQEQPQPEKVEGKENTDKKEGKK